MKKVVALSIENISSNLGTTSHGNGYNALGRRVEVGHFDNDESKTMFFSSILNYIYQNDYVVYLDYKEAFLRAENYGYYSFQRRLDDFLKYSLNFIYEHNTNIDKYIYY